MNATSAATVALLDPAMMNHSQPSPNTGDEIIARAVLREVNRAVPAARIQRYPTHVRLRSQDLDEIALCDWIIVGGSNLLGNPRFSRRRLRYWRQWDLTVRDAAALRRAVLLGVGWREHEDGVTFQAKRLYRRALQRPTGLHSVRDSYTAAKMQELGFANVVNTSCPTLWSLGEPDSPHIARERSDSVLTTVTDYRPDPRNDVLLQELLADRYRRVYIWPQGVGDYAYLTQLKTCERLGDQLEILPPGLAVLDEFLAKTPCDYVGTRLHCGIHCLNAGKRSLVLVVDNRAQEMGRDVGLPTSPRHDFVSICAWIETPTETRLHLDRSAIAAWHGQFAGA